MNKQEAAEFLGVSMRALERYTQQARISVRYEKGRTKPTPVYEEEDLKAFKAQLEAPIHRPAVIAEDSANSRHSLALLSETSTLPNSGAGLERLLTTLESLREHPPVTVQDIAVKPLLKLDEAQRLTGLSREILREAIKTGTLIGGKLGRAYRVKRKDLDAYVQKLEL